VDAYDVVLTLSLPLLAVQQKFPAGTDQRSVSPFLFSASFKTHSTYFFFFFFNGGVSFKLMQIRVRGATLLLGWRQCRSPLCPPAVIPSLPGMHSGLLFEVFVICFGRLHLQSSGLVD